MSVHADTCCQHGCMEYRVLYMGMKLQCLYAINNQMYGMVRSTGKVGIT